jgi:hypothetical protein
MQQTPNCSDSNEDACLLHGNVYRLGVLLHNHDVTHLRPLCDAAGIEREKILSDQVDLDLRLQVGQPLGHGCMC